MKINVWKEATSMEISRSLVGIAGVHFVAAELTQKNYIATLTSRNTQGIDILASNANGTKTVSIQVKTNRNQNKREWILGKKNEDVYSDRFLYVFVNLKEDDKKSDMYIVPSIEVAKYIKKSHENWLKKPGRKGQAHKNTSMRVFKLPNHEIAEKYRNAWHLLKLD